MITTISEFNTNQKQNLKKSLDNHDLKSLTDSRYGRIFNTNEILEMLGKRTKVWLVLADDKIAGYGELYGPKNDGYYEFGYLIFPEFQRKGIGFELAKHILIFCKDNSEYQNLKAESEVTNIASQKLLEKLATQFPPTKIETETKYIPNTKIYKWILS
jgi:RimJ/RimL family protein N-acetyltransferase